MGDNLLETATETFVVLTDFRMMNTAADIAEENAALRRQIHEMFQAHSDAADIIAMHVRDKAQLQAEVERLTEDLRKLCASAARPVADEPEEFPARALGHCWAVGRFPTDRG